MKKFNVIFYLVLFGFLLAVGILEGLDSEAARVFQGHAEMVGLMRAAGKIK